MSIIDNWSKDEGTIIIIYNLSIDVNSQTWAGAIFPFSPHQNCEPFQKKFIWIDWPNQYPIIIRLPFEHIQRKGKKIKMKEEKGSLISEKEQVILERQWHILVRWYAVCNQVIRIFYPFVLFSPQFHGYIVCVCVWERECAWHACYFMLNKVFIA